MQWVCKDLDIFILKLIELGSSRFVWAALMNTAPSVRAVKAAAELSFQL